jgi:hypothetical protein
VSTLELLCQVGAERAEPILEEPRELLPRPFVGELDPHSPVVGHARSIVREHAASREARQ